MSRRVLDAWLSHTRLFEEEVTARLQAGEDREFHGTLSDIRFESEATLAKVSIPSRGPVDLRIGEKVSAHFSSAGLGLPLEIPGRIVHEDRGETASLFRIQLGLTEGGLLSPVLVRREAIRVRPLDGSPIGVSIDLGKDSIETCASDISVSGIALTLPCEAEGEIRRMDRLALAIRLPEEGGALDIIGIIRNRALVGSNVRCGIHFDADYTIEFRKKQLKIRSFVLACQMEVMRRLRRESAGKVALPDANEATDRQ